jgi:hypothetical protein
MDDLQMEIISVILFEFFYVGSISTEGCVHIKAKSDYFLKDAQNNECCLFACDHDTFRCSFIREFDQREDSNE